MHEKRFLLVPALLMALPAVSRAASVPAPYTPVRASSKEFRCLGRRVKLGKMLLPEQITAEGKPLLSIPVRLQADPEDLENVKGESKVLENTGDLVRWEWVGESSSFGIKSRLRAECDGFLWYEIALTPKRPVRLASLALTIPRIGGTARYLHTASFTWGRLSQGLAEYGGRWQDAFMPYIWMGDERRGLAWCAESDESFRLRQPASALRVATEGGRVSFTATYLDHPETLSAPLTLRFGLQPTPVKPVSFRWRRQARILHGIGYDVWQPGPDGRVPLDAMREAGVKTVVFHDTWTDYYGKVATPYSEPLRRLIDECHRRGMKLIVYIGYGLARSAPEMQGHREDWSTKPLIPWETSDRPEFRNFDACCPGSGWADWLVAGIEKLFTDYDLDGLYFDGTSEAWRCQNESHGCGWRDEKGDLHTTYPLLAVRSLMRRIAGTVRRHRPGAILDVHMSGSLTMPTLSCCDSYWDGEQFENHTRDGFELPLHAFRTEFMGYAHGLDAEFLCYTDRPFTFPEAIALAWLHGVEVRPYPDTLSYISPLWRAMDAFGADRAKWLPYWEGPGAFAKEESVKASAWARDGRALLFISHLKREPLETRVHLNRRRLGLASGPLRARDALTGSLLPLEGDSLTEEFDGMSYQLVEVDPAN